MEWEKRAQVYRSKVNWGNKDKIKEHIDRYERLKKEKDEKLKELNKKAESFFQEAVNMYKNYKYSSNNENRKNENRKRSNSLTNNLSYFYNKPLLLLRKLNINSLHDWRYWSLKYHPDKNPDIDLDLIKAVNNAVDLFYK